MKEDNKHPIDILDINDPIESQAGAFEDESRRAEFRQELAELQKELIKYNRMLADIAEVEDLTELEQMEEQQ